MPEMRFAIRWPDGSVESCYSPSLVIKDYFTPSQSYELGDFMTRSRTALLIASDRVKARYGMPCSLALGQLAALEARSKEFLSIDGAQVRVESFEE